MTKRAYFAILLLSAAQASCRAEGTPSNNNTGNKSCTTSADCPVANDACSMATCNDGICGLAPAPVGTPLPDSVVGDCKAQACDAAGNIAAINDDSDIPDDDNACTTDICKAGVVSHSFIAAGFACSDGNGSMCNGAGACVECILATDCPGQDSACEVRTCVAGVCGTAFTSAGTPSASQTPGDCAVMVCDGSGGTTSSADNMDLPVDGNACTADACMNGVPMNPLLPLNSPCNQNGGKVCDSSGACVECNTGSQCASSVCSAGKCQMPSCVDGVKNGVETDADCGGGVCPVCDVGSECVNGSDCVSGICVDALCLPPVVLNTTPMDGQTAVSVNSKISIQFSGAMDPATLTAQTAIGSCAGSVQLSTDGFATCLGFCQAMPTLSAGNSVAEWTPAPALSYGSTYFLRVTTGAHAADGTPLDAQYTSSNGFVTDTPTSSCDGSIVISQVYGAGGNSGATYKNDFVEIHNRGKTAVDLSGWSVQYASAAGSSWLVTTLNGTIAAGGYYLVQGASGVNGNALPTPDAMGSTNMSATAGKVALVHATTALAVSCPMGAPIVDFVGYGTTANCFDGPNPASAASSATQSILRAGAGCVDNDTNKADFASAAVVPRNTMSPALICACPIQGAVNETNLASEIDLCTVQSPTSIMVMTQMPTPAIFGRIFEAGITEAAGANALVIAEVGFGPADVNPTTQSGWQFFPVTYGQQVGNADEYQGSFTAPVPGTYRYTYRASLDGVQWTYCDLNGSGSSAGAVFEITQLPLLTVTQ